MLDLLKAIYLHRMAPVSAGADRVIEILCKELPFVVHEYPSLAEHNGWVVPYKWEVCKAEIRQNDHLVYDGLAHPLGVIGYSQSFQGQITREELKRHLFYHPTLPDALVYHCDLYYKVDQKDWGFCVPNTLFQSLPEGDYTIDLQTVHELGTMKVGDCFLPGVINKTIILNAHNCHAGQANDDIAGMVVGVEVLKRLSRQRNRFSYRLIIAPEHLGTVFYLAGLPPSVVSTFRYCLFLEMLGNQNRLALQESFTGKSDLDRAAYQYLRHYHPDFHADKFRKIVGNDETVWEAPGFEIPTISLSRFPYPEYHSSCDTEAIISEAKLQEAVETVLGILHILESDCVMYRKFKGLVALSNPKFNLYIDMADPSIRPSVPVEQLKWNHLMNCLPRYFDGRMTVLDIAEKHDLPYNLVRDYIGKFQEKGLVDITPPA